MAYTKYHATWEDAPSTDTPIVAAALDHMEDGIAGAAMVYVHDGSAYQLDGGRIFIGPEDPEDDGFTLGDGDEWVDPT